MTSTVRVKGCILNKLQSVAGAELPCPTNLSVALDKALDSRILKIQELWVQAVYMYFFVAA